MIIAAHWDLRKHIGTIRSLPTNDKPLKNGKVNRVGAEARFYILHYLISSANPRLRCFPGIETIMADTGFEKAGVVAALGWLERHGVMYNVPQDKRVGKEAELHPRKKVWQLTGVIELNGAIVPYLMMRDEDKRMVIEELQSYGKKTAPIIKMIAAIGSLNEPDNSPKGLFNEPDYGSLNKRMLNEPEDSTSSFLEGSTREESRAPEEPEQTPPPMERKSFPVVIRGGQDRYADNHYIDVMTTDFQDSCNAIFYAWVDALAAAGCKPDTELDELWSQQYTAVIALAKHRRLSEQVTRYVKWVYSPENPDKFYRDPLKPINLSAVAKNIGGWLTSPPKKSATARVTVTYDAEPIALDAFVRESADVEDKPDVA